MRGILTLTTGLVIAVMLMCTGEAATETVITTSMSPKSKERVDQILEEMEKHPEHVRTVNGKVVSDEEFHEHASRLVGEDYHHSLAHVHVYELEGEELKEHLEHVKASGEWDDLFLNEAGTELNPNTIRRQLKEQGVREHNLDRLTEEILHSHSYNGVSVHKAHHESELPVHDPMEGFTHLISPEQMRKEFRRIDKDSDGKIHLEELRKYFTQELSILSVEGVRTELADSPFAQDLSEENVQRQYEEKKAHFEEQLANIDTVWAGVDENKDGGISFPEYNEFVQVSHWLAHQEKQAENVLGEERHMYDGWREEL